MMGRAERRRTQKLEQKAKTATYNLTKEQLNIAVREQVGKELERIKQEATDDAVNTAMVLLLTLPLEVLMDHYWTKTYAKRIPRFTELVLEYYERWQNGELDMDKLKEDLWEYGGVKLVEGEGRNSMKYVIGIIIGIVCLAGVIALKAISASTTYMDDSFRWGGRDGY